MLITRRKRPCGAISSLPRYGFPSSASGVALPGRTMSGGTAFTGPSTLTSASFARSTSGPAGSLCTTPVASFAENGTDDDTLTASRPSPSSTRTSLRPARARSVPV
jgi:hypothetical protein